MTTTTTDPSVILPEAALYAIIPMTRSLSLKGLGGFREDAEIRFGDGLNVVHGPAGSGRTRILEALVARSGAFPSTPLPISINYTERSPGQRVFAVGRIFLSYVPDDGCLLADDVPGHLDAEHQRLLIRAILVSGKQVILTADDWQIDWMKRPFGNQFTFIDLDPFRAPVAI